MKFYEFSQNNSGGSFDVDANVCHRLFIEAESPQIANAKAEDLGVYFDGCSKDMDCRCCGDRWYAVSDGDGLNFPKSYAAFTKEKAEEVAKTYKTEVRKLKKSPAWGDKTKNWEVIFSSVDQYARLLADEYGRTSPDVRIFYANGAKLEINSIKVDNAKKWKKRKK